jgi:mono/diheme cytochrome c family protein
VRQALDLKASTGLESKEQVMRGAFRMTLALCALLGLAGAAAAQDQAQIEAGEALYDEHCAQCHGEKLRSAGAIPDLRLLKPEDRPRFLQAVNEGRGQMPAWGGQLSDEEIDQIWAYIRAHAR